MRTFRLPALVLATLCVLYIAGLGASAGSLPAKVASHFNAAGRPDGWMSRDSYLLFVGAMGLAMPLFIAGLCYVTRFLPDWMVNLPHKEYWLSAERREETNNYIFGHCLWLSCLFLAHFGGLHWMTVVANNRQPVELPSRAFWLTSGSFLLVLGIWIIALFRRFRVPR